MVAPIVTQQGQPSLMSKPPITSSTRTLINPPNTDVAGTPTPWGGTTDGSYSDGWMDLRKVAGDNHNGECRSGCGGLTKSDGRARCNDNRRCKSRPNLQHYRCQHDCLCPIQYSGRRKWSKRGLPRLLRSHSSDNRPRRCADIRWHELGRDGRLQLRGRRYDRADHPNFMVGSYWRS